MSHRSAYECISMTFRLQIEQVSDASPLGTILAWVPKPEASLEPEPLPDGWLPCDGRTIAKGPWTGGKTPDLNTVGAFLRGGPESKSLEMEDDQVQDHQHVDTGHSHSCSALSSGGRHQHTYRRTEEGSDSDGHWCGQG